MELPLDESADKLEALPFSVMVLPLLLSQFKFLVSISRSIKLPLLESISKSGEEMIDVPSTEAPLEA